jgi:hypothetical protein
MSLRERRFRKATPAGQRRTRAALSCMVVQRRNRDSTNTNPYRPPAGGRPLPGYPATIPRENRGFPRGTIRQVCPPPRSLLTLNPSHHLIYNGHYDVCRIFLMPGAEKYNYYTESGLRSTQFPLRATTEPPDQRFHAACHKG